MSQHNPELTPPPKIDPNAPIQPDAPDFAEIPDVAPVQEDREPIPVWLYLVCGFALFMAGSSFTGFNVFGMGLYDQGPGGPVVSNSKDTQVQVADDPISLGKKIYSGNCANCHQASGEGQPGSYPPMVDSEWVLGSKERLAAIMLHGISGPLTVKGATYGTQQMPGWGGVLTDEKIANVMTYLRASWGNKGDAVKPDEVAAARTKFASQSAAYCEADLLKIAPHPAK
jgi:mono/diheme cytochrome c family protein